METTEIVTKYLTDQGYEGLYGDGCGCTLEDGISPAGCLSGECAAGFCRKAKDNEDCETWVFPFDFETFLRDRREFSPATFGRYLQEAGVMEFMTEIVTKLQANPTALSEYANVILLFMDIMTQRGAPMGAVEAYIRVKWAAVQKGRGAWDTPGRYLCAAFRLARPNGFQLGDLLQACADKLEADKKRGWTGWEAPIHHIVIKGKYI